MVEPDHPVAVPALRPPAFAERAPTFPIEAGRRMIPFPRADGVQHRFAIVGGTRIHYVEAGKGQPLVLLHGWPQHWWSFRKIIGPLATRYRVICPDVRGLGWSDGSPAGYHLVELAADLTGLLDALGLTRVRLVGHDWGVPIGYVTCLRWPDRVEQFVALAGVTLWSGADASRWRLCARAWHVFTLAALGRFALRRFGIAERALRTWRHVGRFTPEEMETYLGPLRRPEAQEATLRFDRSSVFRELPYFLRHYRSARLRTPALHINGAEDPLTLGVAHGYRPYADDMRLELIENCGHFIAEERPEELLDRMRGFFGS